jgi:hypothetical protein
MKVQNRSFHGNGKNGTIGTESGESGTASRRSFIHGLGAGFGSLALEGILQAENPASSHLTKALPHIAPKAKSCIFESYELAFRLQMTAPEALDIESETTAIQSLYGIHDPKGSHKLTVGPEPFGRQCLIARRMVERGVRFVQIFSGGGAAGGQNSWDGHHGIEENLEIHCPEIDKPIAGLLQDLDQRGLLEETLVVWGGEFGRQPVSETFNTGGKPGGRDHNPLGFTYWMAGGGVKAGTRYGETDELGERAVVNRHHLRDLHATILHQMGLDHSRLTYPYAGLDQRLTGVEVEAEVIRGLIA